MINVFKERGYRTRHKTHLVRDVIITLSGGAAGPGDNGDWRNLPLAIPKCQLFNVSASNIFGIKYFLEVCRSTKH